MISAISKLSSTNFKQTGQILPSLCHFGASNTQRYEVLICLIVWSLRKRRWSVFSHSILETTKYAGRASCRQLSASTNTMFTVILLFQFFKSRSRTNSVPHVSNNRNDAASQQEKFSSFFAPTFLGRSKDGDQPKGILKRKDVAVRRAVSVRLCGV